MAYHVLPTASSRTTWVGTCQAWRRVRERVCTAGQQSWCVLGESDVCVGSGWRGGDPFEPKKVSKKVAALEGDGE